MFRYFTNLQFLAGHFKTFDHIEIIENFLHGVVLKQFVLLHFFFFLGQIDQGDKLHEKLAVQALLR